MVLRDGAQLGALFGDEITEDAIMDMIAEAADAEVRRDAADAADERRRRPRDDATRRAPPPPPPPRARDRSALAARLGLTGGWASWLRDRGVYVALLVLVLYNALFTANFLTLATSSCCSPSCRR